MLDVRVALCNPYLLDQFSVSRRTQGFDGFGQVVINAQLIPGIRGIVYPEGANDLARRPEADVTAKTIIVITRFALQGEAETTGTNVKPDILIWNGDSFLVTHVEDYSNFAAGFVKCRCESIDIVDQPPAAAQAVTP